MRTDQLIGEGRPFRTQDLLAKHFGITQGAVAKWAGQVPQRRIDQLLHVPPYKLTKGQIRKLGD